MECGVCDECNDVPLLLTVYIGACICVCTCLCMLGILQLFMHLP